MEQNNELKIEFADNGVILDYKGTLEVREYKTFTDKNGFICVDKDETLRDIFGNFVVNYIEECFDNETIKKLKGYKLKVNVYAKM